MSVEELRARVLAALERDEEPAFSDVLALVEADKVIGAVALALVRAALDQVQLLRLARLRDVVRTAPQTA
jgi:predicted N-acetyltransferase YhbS